MVAKSTERRRKALMSQRPFIALEAAPRTKPSNYPEPFASKMVGRVKRPLGDLFGLNSFGANLTTLSPGAVTALQHVHSIQDEMVFVVAGYPTLVLDGKAMPLAPGMVAGFPAGGAAHHIENRTDIDCTLLEVGDRSSGDAVSYPADDIEAVMASDGKWQFTHKDGTPYETRASGFGNDQNSQQRVGAWLVATGRRWLGPMSKLI